MAQKDLSEKYLEAYNDVFADIVNVLLFGKKVVSEEGLSDGPTESTYKAEDDFLKAHIRDTMKYYRECGIICSMIGIENQSTVDYTMPVRIMGYDYNSYRNMCKESNELVPVINLVLYFGKGNWTGPVSLKEMMHKMPLEMEPFVEDYKINVVNVSKIPKEVRCRLTSDFGEVAEFFANKDKEDYVPSTSVLKHPEAVLHLLRVFSDGSRYEAIEESVKEDIKKGVNMSMCEFAERFERKGIEKGIEKGRISLAVKLYDMKKLTLEEAAEACGLGVEDFRLELEKQNR